MARNEINIPGVSKPTEGSKVRRGSFRAPPRRKGVMGQGPIGYIPWIRSPSRKAKDLKKLLMGPIIKWGRNDGDGLPFFLGCYGNPDNADWVFVAEIPSHQPRDLVEKAYPVGEAWTSAWKVTVSDLLFRVALLEAKLIPSGISDKPWEWKCWITDFVKSSMYANDWDGIRRTDKGKRIIKEGAEVLERELRILRPSFVVTVGNESERYFNRHLRHLEEELQFIRGRVPHYALRDRSPEAMREYLEKFRKTVLELKASRGQLVMTR